VSTNHVMPNLTTTVLAKNANLIHITTIDNSEITKKPTPWNRWPWHFQAK
jgi:hypothetical protein